MTTTVAAVAQSPIELSAQEKHIILENVLEALGKRFYLPEKLTGDWPAAVDRYRPLIESAASADAFEQAVSDLLAELHTSHLGFFHQNARRASSRAALSATYLADDTDYGNAGSFRMSTLAARLRLSALNRGTSCCASMTVTSSLLNIQSSQWGSKPG